MFQTFLGILVVYRHKTTRRLPFLPRRPTRLPHDIGPNIDPRQSQHLVHVRGQHRTVHERRQDTELRQTIFGQRCNRQYLFRLFGRIEEEERLEGHRAEQAVLVQEVHQRGARALADVGHGHLRVCGQGYAVCLTYLDHIFKGEICLGVCISS